MPGRPITLKNTNLNDMPCDFLYHLNINISDTKETSEIQRLYGDVKFICMGGTKSRMEKLAYYIRSLIDPKNTETLIDLCEKADRYAVFKVGPVLCCSHGIGMSSMSVLLHELLKLVMYAKCDDPIFMRIGTCGGLGLAPGTVVVTKDGYNGYLRNEHEIAILGKRIVRPAKFHEGVSKDIVACGNPADNFQTIIGNTLAAECFYEGQGRLDGASCDYSIEEKMAFLQKCYDHGVRNIEMEATMFSSLTYHLNVKAADVCVTLIDRLKGDQVEITMEEKKEFEKRPLVIIGRYIQKSLNC